MRINKVRIGLDLITRYMYKRHSTHCYTDIGNTASDDLGGGVCGHPLGHLV